MCCLISHLDYLSRRTCPNTASSVCLHTCHVCHPSVGLPFLTLVDSKKGQEGSYYLTVLCTLPVPGSGHHHAKRAEVCPSFGGIIQHGHAHGVTVNHTGLQRQKAALKREEMEDVGVICLQLQMWRSSVCVCEGDGKHCNKKKEHFRHAA